MKFFFRFLGLAILFLVLIIFFFSSRESIARFLGSARGRITAFGSENVLSRTLLELTAENERLILELERITIKTPTGEGDRYHYKTARIFSRYPFNDETTVVIDLGSEDGMREHMPVFVARGMLLGRIRSVSRTQSEVETIRNATWRTSVTIGDEAIKSVYVGGPSPILDLIPKEAKLREGDRVISVSPDFPIGTILGTVGELSHATYDVWQQAKVVPAYEPESFSTVFVLVDFP